MCMHKVSLMRSYNSTDIYVHCMKEVKKGNKISLVIQKFIKNKLSKNAHATYYFSVQISV